MNQKLAVKSILGFINLFVMMSLSIFLPRGTIFFTEAWVYLLIFFGGVTVITVYIFKKDQYLLQQRLKVGPVAEPRRAQKIIQFIASIGFIGMYIISGFDQRYHWSELPVGLIVLADVLILFSMVSFFKIFQRNSFLSATIDIQENQRVITDGPYSIVRHPMYLAAIILFLFTPLALGSIWGLTTFPLMVLVLALRCLDEEKILKEDLVGYIEYCNKVRYRLIPYIW